MLMIDLYPRQRKALAKLRSGSILCGGVGSGKSRTALAYYFLRESDRKLYIITTAKKRDSLEWEDELISCCCMGYNRDDVCIDSWNNISRYKDVDGAFFIFDEQRVVGSGTWAKVFIKIARRNHWILLTATPGDNWSDYIPVFIANGFYKNRSDFLARHAVFSRYSKYPKVDRWVGTKRLEQCRKEILVNMPYDAPAKHVVDVVKYDFNYDAYKWIIKTRWDLEHDEPITSPGRLCYLLRQTTIGEGRLRALEGVLSACKKAIIFYSFDYEKSFIEASRASQGYSVAEWNGHRHDSIPDSEKWLYLVQYNAGAEGWNCIETDTIIFFSLSYSYRMMLQASGRIDRCNTPFKELHYYVLVNDSPIEQKIILALKNKKNFNENTYEEADV